MTVPPFVICFKIAFVTLSVWGEGNSLRTASSKVSFHFLYAQAVAAGLKTVHNDFLCHLHNNKSFAGLRQRICLFSKCSEQPLHCIIHQVPLGPIKSLICRNMFTSSMDGAQTSTASAYSSERNNALLKIPHASYLLGNVGTGNNRDCGKYCLYFFLFLFIFVWPKCAQIKDVLNAIFSEAVWGKANICYGKRHVPEHLERIVQRYMIHFLLINLFTWVWCKI